MRRAALVVLALAACHHYRAEPYVQVGYSEGDAQHTIGGTESEHLGAFVGVRFRSVENVLRFEEPLRIEAPGYYQGIQHVIEGPDDERESIADVVDSAVNLPWWAWLSLTGMVGFASFALIAVGRKKGWPGFKKA